MRAELDVAIAGAGAVGLATAAALAAAGHTVAVLERGAGIARETTSRSSQVLHAGLYYPAGSWKARLCREGRERVYERCERLRIPCRRLGKLVVAVEEGERAALERLHALGTANGAPGLELVDGAVVRRLEPAVRAVAALVSPDTGIVDAHALCLSWLAEAEAHGAWLALRHEVVSIERHPEGFRVEAIDPGGLRVTLSCGALVNAAGLESDRVAALAGIDVDARGWRLRPCKGDYFALAPGAPLRVGRLVYPLPAGAGLGVHVTLDLGGRIRFGPDAEYVERPRYDVDPAKAQAFAAAAGRYLPGLRAEWLRPDQAGVRPKLAGPGEGFRDFVVEEASADGLPGLVNLIGIESPGLTAAPAIAARVASLLRGQSRRSGDSGGPA
ncbi:MAG: NAD(P)/FAD-dependent oxidoreductase [Deltaproteobacteria bacterium]|nr:NAD(P)/FAD-dependent oxidoreductase [Deltaproteobacteria bacterium]